jgi:hypothetical protein
MQPPVEHSSTRTRPPVERWMDRGGERGPGEGGVRMFARVSRCERKSESERARTESSV